MENKLKRRRKELGFTQSFVAQKVGVGRPYYAQIENGHRKGSLAVWIAISRVLDFPENELVAYMKERMKKSA